MSKKRDSARERERARETERGGRLLSFGWQKKEGPEQSKGRMIGISNSEALAARSRRDVLQIVAVECMQ